MNARSDANTNDPMQTAASAVGHLYEAKERLKDAAEPLRRALRASLREGVQASRRGANGSTAEHRDPAQASRRRRSANSVAGARLPV